MIIFCLQISEIMDVRTFFNAAQTLLGKKQGLPKNSTLQNALRNAEIF